MLFEPFRATHVRDLRRYYKLAPRKTGACGSDTSREAGEMCIMFEALR